MIIISHKMTMILEKLCQKFARDRDISLEETEHLWYGQARGLEVKCFDLGTAKFFAVKKRGESSVKLAYSQLPNCNERIATIEIKRWCFKDYLTLLFNARSGFAQVARERFEAYLDSPTDKKKYTEQFEEANSIDVFQVLEAFYPNQKMIKTV